ncbi:MAG: protease inhibitor I42 family protein [Candidatus Dormibacteraeota bacterium]|nr:protease inhibitor I42 family protein [Candidatus Dormibacteraeota bacterium]
MRTAVALFVAALVLCACGAAGSGAAPTPSASPSTGQGFDLAVNEKSRTATMRVGQKVEVVLHANPGMTTWSGVRSSDPSVLAAIVNPAATAARGITLAAFQALAPGKATITATAGADCSPGQACPQYALLLTIEVTVVVAG